MNNIYEQMKHGSMKYNKKRSLNLQFSGEIKMSEKLEKKHAIVLNSSLFLKNGNVLKTQQCLHAA